MWTQKYKPKNVGEFIGQKEAVSFFLRFVKNPSKGILFHGPPGVGKSALVHAYAMENNLDLIEMNASDYRSAKKIQEVIGRTVMQQTLFRRGKLIFIDEVDGLFGRSDSGGASEIISIIKESKHPIVLAANNPYNPKLKSLRGYCNLVKFTKASVWDIEKKLKQICESEKIACDENALKTMARMSGGDMRSAINDLENISSGKNKISSKDLDSISSRERERNVFDALKIIFKTRSVLAAKLATNDLDKDPEELFWWIENNIASEYEKPEELAAAFDALSKADLFRRKISHRQNWRLFSYMIDMMTGGVAASKKQMYRKFVKYQYPSNIILLGRTKEFRKSAAESYRKLSQYFHCSSRKFKSTILPYLKVMMRSRKFKAEFPSSFGVNADEMKKLFS